MIVSVLLILSGAGVIAFSGVPALFMSRSSNAGQRMTVALFIAGSVAGMGGALLSLSSEIPPELNMSWAIPWGQFAVSVDRLSVFFLILVFTVPALGAFYGLEYWKQGEHCENGHKLGLFYGLLVGSMALVVISHDAVLFLICWEIMAISAFFALTTEDDKVEVRQTGWIYFVCTHMGTLTLFALFAFWRISTGSFSLTPSAALSVETGGIVFILTLVGFSFKAGFMPLHVWLPGAHANAPSHVSAIMSGVMLKMGIYGIVRMTGLVTNPEPWWGALLLGVGTVTGILGIAFAIGQKDFKRILAYSSIENIGIIGMGIGLALLGRAYNRPDLVLLGMGGALFHVWNHGLFKALLFFNSGAIIHAAHTRDIEMMGGLSKKMPVSAFLFLIGAVSICALPPFNGFAGEWLLYLGLFRTLESVNIPNLAMAGFSAVGLAMIGTLAVATFVKMYGTVFLGSGRSETTSKAHDPSVLMTFPMAILAFFCIAFGVFPLLVSPFLEGAVRDWALYPDSSIRISDLAPAKLISVIGFVLLTIALVAFLWRKRTVKKIMEAKSLTWDCGYAKPTSRMQYTGTSFAQTMVGLFSFILLPITKKNNAPAHFPENGQFETVVPDTFLDRLFLPVFALAGRLVPKLYVFQQGKTHLYVLYIMVMVIMLFLFGGTGGYL